jgi:hypothetical protein
MNFPRTSASLGVAFGDVLRTLVRPTLAGLVMVAAIMSTRLAVGELGLPLRTVILIAVGAATYLIMITLLDRDVWWQLRQLVSARGANA